MRWEYCRLMVVLILREHALQQGDLRSLKYKRGRIAVSSVD